MLCCRIYSCFVCSSTLLHCCYTPRCWRTYVFVSRREVEEQRREKREETKDKVVRFVSRLLLDAQMRTPFALLPKTSSLPGLSDHDPQTRYVRTQMQTETPELLDLPSGNMGYDRRRDDRRSTFPLHYDDTMTMTRTNSAPIAGPLRTRLMDLGAFRGLWKTTGTAAAQAQTGAEEHAPLRTISRTISRTSSTSDMAAEYDGSIQKSPKDGPGTITITTRDVVELTATRSGSSTGLGATSSNAPLDATNSDSRKAKTKKALLAFWKFSITPIGFFVVLYGLNVVAWGGMLFLLMLHAAPAMNHPDNGDADDSPRKVWIEIDSQILNGMYSAYIFDSRNINTCSASTCMIFPRR